jgi:NifU-like protein involved in Fe-S cluster formation
MAVDTLPEEVRRLFRDLAHSGEAAAGTSGAITSTQCVLCGEAGTRVQGTWVRFQLLLQVPQRTVLDVRYRAYGCPYTLATCEWLARRLPGQVLPQLSPEGLAAAVGGAAEWAERLAVPADRLGRLLVIEDALRAALAADHNCSRS